MSSLKSLADTSPTVTGRGSRLRPGVAVIANGDHIQLRAGDEDIFILETDACEDAQRWLRQLAAGLTVAEVQAGIPTDGLPMWNAVVAQLESERLLSDQQIDPGDEIATYLSHCTAPGALVERPQGQIIIHGKTRSAQLLAAAVAEHRFVPVLEDAALDEAARPATSVVLEVCLWEQADLSRTMQINAQAVAAQRPCLFVDLSHGRHATVGPFYVPGEGACFHCYRQRWRQNTAAPEEFDAATEAMMDRNAPLPAYGLLPASRYQVVGIACAELFAFLTRHRPLRTLNRIVTVDLEGLQMASEPCWQIPWCATCNTAASHDCD